MAKLLQLRRGTTAENDLFTGAIAEVTYDTDKKELRVHDGSTQGGLLVGVKAGFVCSFAGATAPDGWLVCDGSAISRTNYADLFAQIGTTYGDGDGSTTFNLPDVADCFIQGGTSGTLHTAGLPNVKFRLSGIATHRGSTQATDMATAVYLGELSYTGGGDAAYYIDKYAFDVKASNDSSIYGNSGTVQPKSVEMLFCIKY